MIGLFANISLNFFLKKKVSSHFIHLNPLVCSSPCLFFLCFRLDSLKESLEGYSDRDKLEAMRRLIGMMSQGTDVSAAVSGPHQRFL